MVRISSHFRTSLILLFAVLVLSGCASRNVAVKQPVLLTSVSQLKYLNTYVLPYNQAFANTTVGGLSSIDFDPKSNTYYLISDDRSHINPARFYTAKIDISAKGIDQVTITGVHTMLQKDGSSYPQLTKHATRTTDPEGMRYNGITHQLTWTSEGDRIVSPEDTTLIDPTITVISTNGKYIDSIPLPDNLRMRLTESGPRRNGVLEGLTFANDFKTLFVNLEEPLYQDGPRAGLVRNKAFVRIYQFDLKNKKNTAQYAYELEPIALPPAKEGAEINNGIPDILWLGDDRLLVTERAYSGGKGTNLKVFMADLKGADNIINLKSMIKTPVSHPIKKKLLLNMDDLGIYIDNIEGATFGPKLPNGHQTLIFAADNNFNPKEEAQFMIFEVIP
ncbi:esterase-like activity of phytase family protein [Pedobacter sp. L105]|uniref:esterase-like activity of phytase family protein n=1 Tax=Pedobacter sp. L105 TaxID=1641871 RepID=UPI00131B1E33|nr:esterase-like activity of phytase family protein [Pedobacter sp. L105]